MRKIPDYFPLLRKLIRTGSFGVWGRVLNIKKVLIFVIIHTRIADISYSQMRQQQKKKKKHRKNTTKRQQQSSRPYYLLVHLEGICKALAALDGLH